MLSKLTPLALAGLMLGTAACASTNTLPTQNVPLVQGPPIQRVASPYEPALTCLATALTLEQRATSFSIGYFQDRTGKTNYVSESGTGAFSTQGGEDMVLSSLAATGVTVVDTSPQFRGQVDWMFGKVALTPGANLNVSLMFPDVIISGAITSFDFMPGGEQSLRVAGVGGSQSQSRVLVRMDGRAVRMPGGQQAAGILLASERIDKQIVGYQQEAGVTSFFGPNDSATLVEFNLGERQNEAIQYMEGVMIDRLVARLVADTFDVTACDGHIAWGDSLARLE